MHGHVNLLDEHEICTDLKCPCEELGMSQIEIDIVDNVVKAHPVIVEFQTSDMESDKIRDAFGDVVLIWEWDFLDLGWNDYRTAVKASNWFERTPDRLPRLAPREEPRMSKNRK